MRLVWTIFVWVFIAYLLIELSKEKKMKRNKNCKRCPYCGQIIKEGK